MGKLKATGPIPLKLGTLRSEVRQYFASNPILLKAGKVVLAAVMVEITRRVTTSINNAISQD